MAMHRKKPVVVAADQWNGPGFVVPGVQREWVPTNPLDENGDRGLYLYYVVTAHGQKTLVTPGDWIIAEPDGRGYYPCKPDIFEKTYEPVE